jgi:CBS domain-containing protein
MNPNPVFLRTSDTIARGAELIMAKQRRSLPVVDEEDRFTGMFTANCLLYLVLPKVATMEQGLDSLPYVQYSVDDLRENLKKYLDMPVTLCLKTEHVAVVHPDMPIVETLLTLYKARTNLPVVDRDSGRLVGTISYYSVGAMIMGDVESL